MSGNPASVPPRCSMDTGRPGKDHRAMVNGILWVLRTSAPRGMNARKLQRRDHDQR